MFSKINYYIFKKFLYSFLITFIILAAILFIGDFVEQFRKTAGRNVPFNIVLQLTLFNFPNLISYTLPITSFFSSILAILILIRNSELTVISVMGISNLKTILPALILHFFIGIIFITLANPLIAIFDDKYSNLKYEYIDRVDKFASITKNGLWLKQDNYELNLTSVLYAKSTEREGRVLNSFMILEYDDKGAFNGRIDGKKAELEEGYWKMFEIQVTPKYGETIYQNYLNYKTNIKPEDISDSLSSPSSISIWRLLTFISFLEELGYSAIDFKMHLYSLISLPFFISTLVLLAFCLVQGIKQNDKFSRVIVSSLIIIFLLYFISNLLHALGSTSQIHPVIANFSMPVITFTMALFIYQYWELKRKKVFK
jgi:lipopolysaccharide export system permease protein|tara:strand:- start:3459 stop:4568 length:1110 start_codon:yes stop_codon:yes gene_type:complete